MAGHFTFVEGSIANPTSPEFLVQVSCQSLSAHGNQSDSSGSIAAVACQYRDLSVQISYAVCKTIPCFLHSGRPVFYTAARQYVQMHSLISVSSVQCPKFHLKLPEWIF